jgi:hypothetical protein
LHHRDILAVGAGNGTIQRINRDMAEQLAAAESSVAFQLCDELACRHAVMLAY